MRAKIVLLAAEGLANTEIAKRVDMSADRVGDWRRRFLEEGLKGSKTERGRVARAVLPPEEVAQVKTIACDPPRSQGVPLPRFSRSETDLAQLMDRLAVREPKLRLAA